MRRYLWIVLVLALFGTGLHAQSDIAFPHMAVGAPWETVVQIVNEVGVNNTVTIEVYQGASGGTAGNGQPLSVRFDGAAPAVSRTVTLSPFQELTTVLTGADATVRNGWVRVFSTTAGGKVSGSLLFRTKTGTTVTESVGVTSPQQYRHGIIQVDNRDAGTNTGLAFVNPYTVPIVVTLDLFQGDVIFATHQETLQPRAHFARFLNEIPAFASFGARQGTLVVETAENRQIPYVTLRLDGTQLTSIPVRPLGFVFNYTITNAAGATVETGFWLFDFQGFELVGIGRRDSDPAGQFFGVRGSWFGRNFQFTYRQSFAGNTFGVVVFNGTSAGNESTRATPTGNSEDITGRVTVIGPDGQISGTVNNFRANHKF